MVPFPVTLAEHTDILWLVAILAFMGLIWYARQDRRTFIEKLTEITKWHEELVTEVKNISKEFYKLLGEHNSNHH